MAARVLLFLIFLYIGRLTCSAQGISTFSFTIPDTLNYASLSSRAVLLNEDYFIQSSGFGMDGLKGYNMVTRITEDGEIVFRKMNYDTLGRYIPSGALATDGISLYSAYSKVNVNMVSSVTYANVEIAKLTADLDTIWKYTFPQNSYVAAIADILISESDQSLIIIGSRVYPDSLEANEFDGFFLKLNNEGDSLDFKTFEDGANLYFLSATLINDRVYIGGSGYSNGNQYDGVVYKINLSGNLIDHYEYPNHYNLRVSGYSGENYLLSGTPSNMNNLSSRLILVDTGGAEIWNKLHTIDSTVFDQYYSRRTVNNDIVSIGLIGLGSSPEGNAGFISRSTPFGDLMWNRRYNYNSNTDFFTDVLETSDGGLLIDGSATDPGAGGQNLWIIKLDSMGCLEPNCWVGLDDVEPNKLGVSIFPNPANDWLNFKLQNKILPVTLELFSISGQQIINMKLTAPLEAIQVSHLTAGLYLAKFTLGDGSSVTNRIMIVR